jgi:hypothetical protein
VVVEDKRKVRNKKVSPKRILQPQGIKAEVA